MSIIVALVLIAAFPALLGICATILSEPWSWVVIAIIILTMFL